ncbi:ABC transporter permease [soil metagenome]
MNGVPLTLLQDLRHGARLMLRRPGLALVSILTLSVGIGLTAFMFSLVKGTILTGLPFEDADRVVAVTRTDIVQGYENMGVPLHDLETWRDEQQVFGEMGTWSTGTFNVSGSDGADRYDGGWVSANLFDLLRVQPVVGRNFGEGEDLPGAQAVAILGWRLWQDRFGGDPAALGQTLRVNGEEAVIVGVMEEGFAFPVTQGIWLPERRRAVQYVLGASGVPQVNVVARLRDGVSLDQANVQVAGIAARLRQAQPDTHENIGAAVVRISDQFIGSEARQLLWVMLVGVLGVLLIACANVANLLLSQAALRAREVGIRTALGASRGRILTQFLTEPLVMAATGAVLGLGLAHLGIGVFERAIASTEPPFWFDFGIDGRVLLFVMAITLLATFLAGVMPAIRASNANVNEVLKDDSRGAASFRGGRLTRAIVIGEVALAVILLAGAGLMIRSVVNLGNAEYEFATEEVLTARLGLPEADRRYEEAADRVRFFESVETGLAAEPGVEAVALTSALPGLWAQQPRIEVEGRSYERPSDRPLARSAVITPGFFETFATGVLEGRAFGTEDQGGSLPVAIVNRSFAERHFSGGTAVGSRIRVGGEDGGEPWRTIVGIAPDLHMAGANNDEPEGFYVPLAQDTSVRFMSIAARSTGDPASLAPAFRSAVSLVDADIPIYWVRTLDDFIAAENWFYGVFGALFSLMGFVALLLAAIGLYGVMSFSVSRRTREMGVRMALGAEPGDVVLLVMKQGAGQLAIGLVLGLLGALAVSGLLANFLFGVNPRDPATFGAIVVVLSVTGLLASWIPARRATRVDPAEALRHE